MVDTSPHIHSYSLHSGNQAHQSTSPNADTPPRNDTQSAHQHSLEPPLPLESTEHSTPHSSWLENQSDVIPSEVDQECISITAKCLHAQDSTKMIQILSHVQNTEHTYTVICVEFGLSLVYFKLKRYPDTRQQLQN